MKTCSPILMILLFCFVTLIVPGTTQKGSDLAAEVQSAAKLILSRSPKTEDVHKSMIALIDAVCKIADQDTRLPAGFRGKMQEASRSFAQNRIGRESEASLKAAYQVLHGGQAFAFPEGAREIEVIRRIAREYIDRSIREIESGRSDQAARDILSFVLLVVTPVRDRPGIWATPPNHLPWTWISIWK